MKHRVTVFLFVFSALKHIKLTNCDTKTCKKFLQQLSAQLFLELPQNRQKMEVCQLELFGLVSFFSWPCKKKSLIHFARVILILICHKLKVWICEFTETWPNTVNYNSVLWNMRQICFFRAKTLLFAHLLNPSFTRSQTGYEGKFMHVRPTLYAEGARRCSGGRIKYMVPLLEAEQILSGQYFYSLLRGNVV